jgi:hypothetical protein
MTVTGQILTGAHTLPSLAARAVRLLWGAFINGRLVEQPGEDAQPEAS